MKKSFTERLYGNKKKDNETNEGDLKQLIKGFDDKIIENEKKALYNKAKAKAALKAGNEPLAKTYLKTAKQHQTEQIRYHGMKTKAERYLSALNQAKLTSQVTNVFGKTATTLKAQTAQINPEKVAQMTEDAESAIDSLDETMDILSEDLSGEADMDLDNELAALDSQNMLEDVGNLPETSDVEPEGQIAEPGKQSKEDIQKEIARMKKELS